MNIINDLITVIKGLSLIDYILYFSVLILIILTVGLIYILKTDNNDIEKRKNIGSDFLEKPEETNELDLQHIATHIDEKPKPLIDMTSYEEEQEQKAIISYDELLNSNKKNVTFEKEQLVDDCIPTKKINLTDMIKEDKDEEYNQATIFHYEREEAFLQTLKELKRLLN